MADLTAVSELFHKAFVEKTPFLFCCLCHAEVVFLVGRIIVRDVRLELTDRHTHTHRPSTVTLTAHAHQRQIRQL